MHQSGAKKHREGGIESLELSSPERRGEPNFRTVKILF